MAERALVFDCDGDTLVGILHEPEVNQRGMGMLVIVGGPQYRVGSHRQFVLMARQLADAGYPVLRFDYRGMGDSEGTSRGFEDVAYDIRAAIDALVRELPSIRGVVAFGLCDAASAALMYSPTDPRIAALVLANPWVRTEAGEAKARVRHYYSSRLLSRAFWSKVFSGHFNAWGSVRSLLSTVGRTLRHGKVALEANDSHYIDLMLAGLAGSRRPVLLLMSEHDLTAREFDDLCRSSKGWTEQLTSPRVRRFDVPGADHTFSTARSLDMATAAVIGWLRDSVSEAGK